MKKLALKDLNKFFDAISADQMLYMPLEKGGSVNYGVYSQGDNYDPTVLHTVKSVKDVFFPQCENMASFVTEGKKFSVTPIAPVDQSFTVFGVRACDVRGMEALDKVFLSDPVDSYYAARRAHGTIISVVCNAPEETCFCTAFGIDPTNPGADVEATIAGEDILFNSLTEKGAALLSKVADLLSDADDTAADSVKANTKEILKKLPLADIDLSNWGRGKTDELFDRPEWDELCNSCIGCGTCTYVCPTCQCYDIRDYKVGDKTTRYRCWDSCMYSDFTMAAHGTNRPDKKQRFRQRFMHKLVYFPDRYGMFSCVGCGRCVAKCPVSMNIVKVIKAMGGKNNE